MKKDKKKVGRPGKAPTKTISVRVRLKVYKQAKKAVKDFLKANYPLID